MEMIMSRYFAFTPYTHISLGNVTMHTQYALLIVYLITSHILRLSSCPQRARSILIVFFFSNTLNGKQCTLPHRIEQKKKTRPTLYRHCCTTYSISSIPYSRLFILIVLTRAKVHCTGSIKHELETIAKFRLFFD